MDGTPIGWDVMKEIEVINLKKIYYPEEPKSSSAYSAIKVSLDSLHNLLEATILNIHKIITTCVDIMEIGRNALLPRSAICNSVCKIASLAEAYYEDPSHVSLVDIQYDFDFIRTRCTCRS